MFEVASRRSVYRHAPFDQAETDWLATEVPVALSYNGISHVVMMATPTQLEAFALGFSLSEGIIETPSEIYGIEITPACNGIEIAIELSSRRFMALKERRRNLAGRTGCGICGIEQLAQIERPLQPLSFRNTTPQASLNRALEQLEQYQPLGRQTGATHIAVWFDRFGEIRGSAEDVGRHVALDKLLGLRAQSDWGMGAVLVSSRASYEMVQKAVACGVESLFALSAATELAANMAERYQLTLAGFCRPNRLTLYSHPQRLVSDP